MQVQLTTQSNRTSPGFNGNFVLFPDLKVIPPSLLKKFSSLIEPHKFDLFVYKGENENDIIFRTQTFAGMKSQSKRFIENIIPKESFTCDDDYIKVANKVINSYTEKFVAKQNPIVRIFKQISNIFNNNTLKTKTN